MQKRTTIDLARANPKLVTELREALRKPSHEAACAGERKLWTQTFAASGKAGKLVRR